MDNDDDNSPDVDPVLNDPEIPPQHRYFRLVMSTESASIDLTCPVECIQSFDSFVSSDVYSLLVSCDETIRDLEKQKFKKFLESREEVKKE